jgi:hypothetical protein
MTKVTTFTATIYVGFREQYTDEVRAADMAHALLQRYADMGGLCVTVTPTRFIYKGGSEPGIAVGLINYPRFPEESQKIRDKAFELALALMRIYRQLKVSVVFPDETVMLSQELGVTNE